MIIDGLLRPVSQPLVPIGPLELSLAVEQKDTSFILKLQTTITPTPLLLEGVAKGNTITEFSQIEKITEGETGYVLQTKEPNTKEKELKVTVVSINKEEKTVTFSSVLPEGPIKIKFTPEPIKAVLYEINLNITASSNQLVSSLLFKGQNNALTTAIDIDKFLSDLGVQRP